MYSNDIKNKFVALRGLGKSYHDISIDLGVSEKTLKQWGARFADKIRDAESHGLDVAIELYNFSRAGRLQVIGDDLRRIDAELLKRDLSSIPASKLIMLKLAELKLAGDIVGVSDVKKEDNTLSPWDVMMNMLNISSPEENELEIEKQKYENELIELRMLKYGGSADFSDKK